MHILREIKDLRRRDMDKKERFRLNAEDMREDADLRKVIIEALAFNVSRILPGGKSSRSDADAQKAAEAAAGRQSSDAEWVRQRGENGRNNTTGPRDPRQQ